MTSWSTQLAITPPAGACGLLLLCSLHGGDTKPAAVPILQVPWTLLSALYLPMMHYRIPTWHDPRETASVSTLPFLHHPSHKTILSSYLLSAVSIHMLSCPSVSPEAQNLNNLIKLPMWYTSWGLQLFFEWTPYSLNLKSVCSVNSPVSLGFFIWRTTNWGSEPCSDCEYPTLSLSYWVNFWIHSSKEACRSGTSST